MEGYYQVGGVEGVHVAQDRGQWRGPVNTATNSGQFIAPPSVLLACRGALPSTELLKFYWELGEALRLSWQRSRVCFVCEK
jgi:hypothetical protein